MPDEVAAETHARTQTRTQTRTPTLVHGPLGDGALCSHPRNDAIQARFHNYPADDHLAESRV